MNITVTIAGASNPITLSTEGPTAAQITNALGYTPANPTSIDAEVAARIAADTNLENNLQYNIDGEAFTRTQGDLSVQLALQNNINAEEAARIAADNAEALDRSNADDEIDIKARSVRGFAGFSLFFEEDVLGTGMLDPYAFILSANAIPDDFANAAYGGVAPREYGCVALGENVTSIGAYAFYENPIFEIIIPDNVATIGMGAFMYSDLKRAIIGSGLTAIGGSIFHGCYELTHVEIHAINCPPAFDSESFPVGCVIHAPKNGVGYPSTIGNATVVKDL